ncbi:MAG: hypothetical protein EOM50_08445 [Erysipelotrichia bacterium]|nr:hypothetical protein [Erysipelotrichia bacterium]NCC54575.1 hypothetical protein [Erysipelotrichia bacterium]
MRRFIYDGILLVILVMIGLSISEPETIDQQAQLDHFQAQIKSDQVVSEVEKKSSLNQIEENHASSLAKSTSDALKGCIDFTVETLSSIFELMID